MLSKKSFVITIGDLGTVIALHDGSKIKNKVFVKELSDKHKTELKTLFEKNKSASILILLDTIDQTYKKKLYPAVAKMNLKQIAQRDMDSDGDKESLKNYIILDPKKSLHIKKSECLFVSMSSSDMVAKWIEYLAEMPNHLTGIHALPVESVTLFNLLKKDIRESFEVKENKHYLYCVIIQNKVSGFRQLVFSEQGLAFTRVVNYNFEESDWMEKYEQDIYSTFEYLKRSFNNISIKELPIINILSSDTLKKIKDGCNNPELTFVNFTPYQAAVKSKFKTTLKENSNFCDLLFSKIASKKTSLKFTIPKIVVLERFYTALKMTTIFNSALIIGVGAVLAYTTLSADRLDSAISKAKKNHSRAERRLKDARTKALGNNANDKLDNGELVSLERIMDLGKIDEVLSNSGRNFIELYAHLGFLKNFNVQLSKFSYSIENFDSKRPKKRSKYNSVFTGDISNESGDIEDLFKKFDSLSSSVKKSFKLHKVKYSEMPRNIDFTKKYYTFPIDFTVTKK